MLRKELGLWGVGSALVAALVAHITWRALAYITGIPVGNEVAAMMSEITLLHPVGCR